MKFQSFCEVNKSVSYRKWQLTHFNNPTYNRGLVYMYVCMHMCKYMYMDMDMFVYM